MTLPRNDPQLKPATKTVTNQFYQALEDSHKGKPADYPEGVTWDGQTAYVAKEPNGTKADATKDEA